MRRDEPNVLERFQKDPAQEDFLLRLNQLLEPHDRQWTLPGQMAHPTVHIIGPPRSGTTFLNQLVCHHLDIGYIDHLIAAFWRAPIQGILLSRKLLHRRGESQFDSELGRTIGITEPHEFGYFWSTHLRYPDMCQRDESHARTIDWVRLCDVLQRMTRAYERPILFKPFLLIWHLRDFQRVAPNSLFLRVRRNPVANAMSLLRARAKFLKDASQWLSLRPLACRDLDGLAPWRQVVAQVHHLEQWLDTQTHRLLPGTVLELDYDDVCRDPASAVTRVQSFLEQRGVPVVQLRPVPDDCIRPAESATQGPEAAAMARHFEELGRPVLRDAA